MKYSLLITRFGSPARCYGLLDLVMPRLALLAKALICYSAVRFIEHLNSLF